MHPAAQREVTVLTDGGETWAGAGSSSAGEAENGGLRILSGPEPFKAKGRQEAAESLLKQH